MLKIIFTILFALLEIPFFIKFLKAHRECELTREVAILIIMTIIGLIIFGLYRVTVSIL